jgi:arogenate dehydrogenase (NADP+)
MTALWRRHPVGIVGLGLIGGSLGLELQAAGAEVKALVHREATAATARRRGLAAEVSTDPAVLRDCGLMVLALPLDRLLDPVPELVAALPAEAVITDVGSVKLPVLARWEGLVGGRFVAGHPMAGTARSGVEAGELGLFRGRPWVATPSGATDPAALEAVKELAGAVGARWLTCDAADHDRAVALISHLPVLVSAALLQSADRGSRQPLEAGATPAGAGSGPEEGLPALVRALASSGFADTTRVGGGNPELGTLMARSNREAVLAALRSYREAFTALEAMVERSDWAELRQSLEDCQRLRPDFL